jgi:hypothetical protein
LKLVAKPDRRGVSEWFILSAFVVSAAEEHNVGRWQRETLAAFGRTQRTDLHFKDLNDRQRRAACLDLASRPCRLFAVMSNKKNVQNYRNMRTLPERDWFYWWMLRLLLERVTLFCHRHANARSIEPRTLKLVFSRNSRLNYARFKEYLGNLREQSRLGTMFLKTGDLKWDVIDLSLMETVGHKDEAGVQFADVVASAFYQAVSLENHQRRCSPEFAKLLQPRIFGTKNGQYLGFGIKPMPAPPKMGLQPAQREIFEFYGYPKHRW